MINAPDLLGQTNGLTIHRDEESTTMHSGEKQVTR